MSFDSARPRFAVVPGPAMADSSLRAPCPHSFRMALRLHLQVVFLLTALVLGGVGLVQLLDPLLDRLHDWIS